MKIPLNIGTLPPVSASLGAVLKDPARHLSIAIDPDLAFGRLSPRGSEWAVTAMPVIILLLHGRLVLSCDGTPVDLAVGETVAHIAAGRRLEWSADDDCEVVVVADPRLAFEGEVASIDLKGSMEPSASPSEAVLLSPVPQCAIAILHETTLLAAGLWSATPYGRRPVAMAVSEIMYLLEGAVTLATPEGQTFRFDAGEVLLAPQGATLAWENAVPVRKLFISTRVRTY